MTVFYFQSLEGLRRFSHGPSHRAGWDWWNRTVKEHPDLSIMHEVYEAPAGSWENVYINYWPTSFGMYTFFFFLLLNIMLAVWFCADFNTLVSFQ